MRSLILLLAVGCAGTTPAPQNPSGSCSTSPEPSAGERVLSIAPESRVPLVERKFGLMAGYVDVPGKPNVVAFVVFARNGQRTDWGQFDLNDARSRKFWEGKIAEFLAPGHWVAMQPAQDRGSRRADDTNVHEWKLDDHIAAHVTETTLWFDRDGRMLGHPPWDGLMPTLDACSTQQVDDGKRAEHAETVQARVGVSSIAFDPPSQLVWINFVPTLPGVENCGERVKFVHGFQMASVLDYLERVYPDDKGDRGAAATNRHP